jgi:hypothetical protein
MAPALVGPYFMLIRITFLDTHVRTCETEVNDDLDVANLNKLYEYVYAENQAAGDYRWAVVVDENWVDTLIVDVKVKDADKWVGPEKLRPRVGVDIRTPPPAAPPVPSPAPAVQPTLF